MDGWTLQAVRMGFLEDCLELTLRIVDAHLSRQPNATTGFDFARGAAREAPGLAVTAA